MPGASRKPKTAVKAQTSVAYPVISVALNALDPDPQGIRITGERALDELAASLNSVGQLQNLIVVPGGAGRYTVKAGNRRLAALARLREAGEIPAEHPVDCKLIPDARALEAAIAENESRRAMHPADQFLAFQRLAEAGLTVADVAGRFGVTERLVSQRLKLAAVSPRLLALYRREEMTLSHVMAFTVSADHAAQEAAWFEAAAYDRSPGAITRRLTEALVSTADRRARFVGVEAYKAAGGRVQEDLFAVDDAHSGYLTDPALLERLVRERLENEAERLRAGGWSWVAVLEGTDHSPVHALERTYPEPVPLTEAETQELAAIEAEIATLERLEDTDELTAEQAERLEVLAARLNRPGGEAWSEDQKARAGCFVAVGYRGDLEVHAGLIRPGDRARSEAQGGTADGEAVPGAQRTPARGGLSYRLIEELGAHHTAALRAEVATRPRVALVLLAHALAADTFYATSCLGKAVEVRGVSAHLGPAVVEGAAALTALERRTDRWRQRLPAEPEELWAWLETLTDEELTAFIAVCVAHTVNATRPRHEAGAGRLSAVAVLARAVDLDMTRWWAPEAAFIAGMRKEAIFEAITESGADAGGLHSLKKAALAEAAAPRLAAKGWLPKSLRTSDRGEHDTAE